MGTDPATVLCDKCGTPLQTPDHPKSDDIVTCPYCGDVSAYKDFIEKWKKLISKQIGDSSVDTL
jgi:DNA-directed RNA polymerase subunit RPC12/RpoP